MNKELEMSLEMILKFQMDQKLHLTFRRQFNQLQGARLLMQEVRIKPPLASLDQPCKLIIDYKQMYINLQRHSTTLRYHKFRKEVQMFKTVHHAIPMQKLQTLLPAPFTLKTSRLADYLSSQNQFMDWLANVKTLQSMS